MTEPKKPQRPASLTDDDFPVDNILSQMLKEDKSEQEKENVKRKLVQEFPGVDDVVIDVALRSAKYDERRAREVIKKLKGDDDKKKGPGKGKKQTATKPKAAVSSTEQLNKPKGKATTTAAKAKSTSQELHVKATPTSPTPQPAPQPKPQPAVKPPSPAPAKVRVSASTIPGPDGQSGMSPRGAARSTQAQPKMVSPRANQSYHSSLRCVPSGPNPANAQGPNPLMLLPEWVQPEGPQRANYVGPQRSNVQGPARQPSNGKMPLNCGAQASNHQGSNINLVHGSVYPQTTML